MNLCNTCKFNKEGFCSKFYISCAYLKCDDTCTGYKKKRKNIIRNTIKKKAIKQEKRLSEKLGAKLTPQSGAQDTSPGDMILGNYIIESKSTSKKSISLKQEWLNQLKQSPINYKKIPTLILEFSKQEKYVILDFDDFQRII